MAGIGLALTNVILGMGSIGAGIGFGVAEQKKMDELGDKSKTLKDDVAKASDMYDHIYYLVAVNVDRVKKALDKLPSDMLDKLEKDITSDISDSEAEKAIKTLAQIMGYAGDLAGLSSGLLQVVRYFRNRKANNEEPPEPTPVEEPFRDVPLDGEEPPVIAEGESSMSKTPKLDRAINGLNIAGIVFGVAGLAATIGLGVWTIEKLNKAIDDVEKKQKQVSKYQTAMTTVLDTIVEAAGLPAKNYDQLKTMAAAWKTISENFDSYEKALYYAIKGYYSGKSLDEVKKLVNEKSDPKRPFPEGGYPLAKTLADDIKVQFKQGKTDKQIVAFFATENPHVGLRFVFDEFFISMLRF